MSSHHPPLRAQGSGAGGGLLAAIARSVTLAFSQNRRSRASWARGLAGLMTVALCSGCNLNQDGVAPPDNRIFFPGGAIIESAGPGLGRWLYVVNSNSDLRYNAGSVVAVDLHRVRDDYPTAAERQRWKPCRRDTRYVPPANIAAEDQCCWDFLDPSVLNCDDQKYVARQSSVRVGNFGGRPVMQQLSSVGSDGMSRRRMFVPVRGDAAIGMIEVATPTADEVRFSCQGPRSNPTSSHGNFPVCSGDWQITRKNNLATPPLPENEVERLPSEPYALAVDDGLQLLYVGHLRGGGVSLIDLGAGEDSRRPELLQVFRNLLPGDASGAQGVTSLTIGGNGGCGGPVYVSSRYTPLIGSFVVYGVDNNDCNGTRDGNPESSRGALIVGTGQFMSTGLGTGSETRGIEFVRASRDVAPDRAFILQRTPPALAAVSTTTQLAFATIEVCQSPTNLAQQVDANGRAVALFVTCFDGGEVYVIDPWIARLRAVVTVGRGPVATVLPPPGAQGQDALRAYVVGFGANNISVLDLDPAGGKQYRVVQRIGFSSPTPREAGPR